MYPGNPDDDLASWLEYEANSWTVYLRDGVVSGSMFTVRGDAPAADRIVDLADALQDFVVDATWVARPRCPGHPHPMMPRLVESTAWWVCPKSSAIRCEIGAYEAFARDAGLTIVDA